MLTAVEATLRADGTIEAAEPLPTGRSRRVIITILDDAPEDSVDAELGAWRKLGMSAVGKHLADDEDYGAWADLEDVKRAAQEEQSEARA